MTATLNWITVQKSLGTIDIGYDMNIWALW